LNSAQAIEDDEDSSSEMEGACALPLKKYGPELPTASENIEDVLQIETSKILELFPNFGVGYIRKLLLFYDKSSEKVVAKILEGI
jgi:CUE domain